ncbi:MAG: glycosyltransferase [Planctomycetota bacterium]
MRILHLIARLNDGGPARVVQQLAHATREAGHEVLVGHGAVGDGEPDRAPRLAADGVPLAPIAHLGRRVTPADDLRAAFAVDRLLRSFAPDLVHTHTAKAGALGRPRSALRRIPCLHTYHGHVLSGYFGPTAALLVRGCERLLARSGDAHALSPRLVAELHRGYGVGRPDRWHALPLPVEPVRPCTAAWHARLPQGHARIGFLGRLAPVKDLGLWLAVLARVARQQRVCGVVCGQGPEAHLLDAPAPETTPVVHPGHVPAAEALGGIDLLLMTSRNEGLPLAAIEAAGAGIPVVAPGVGGLIDLGQAGLVRVARREPDALAAAVLALLRDPGLRSRRCAQARTAAAAFAPARVLPRYLALYTRLAKSGADRRLSGRSHRHSEPTSR